MAPVLKAYIDEPIEAEKAGLEVEVDRTPEPEPVPEELQERLDEDPALATAFEALTPGRQREYVLYFSGAKQAKTRRSRVERYVQQILAGKGMRDR